MLYHAIENTAANIINAAHMQRMLGRLSEKRIPIIWLDGFPGHDMNIYLGIYLWAKSVFSH